jgi:hypothetical protein
LVLLLLVLPPAFDEEVFGVPVALVEPEPPLPDVPLAVLDDDATWPLTSTCCPTCSRRSGVVPRRRYLPEAALPPVPLGVPPLIAGDGDVLPARAADSVVPDPGGVGDDTAVPSRARTNSGIGQQKRAAGVLC